MKRDLKAPISPDDVNAFLEAKIPAGEGGCPRCGANEWQVAVDEADHEISGLMIVDQHLEHVGIYATIVLNCEICGFISLHAKQRIIDWLDEIGR